MTMKKDTREKILESALALFRERGFAEATMREIAARAGVAIGLAYYYFDSKDSIVLAKFKYFEPNRRFLGALMAHAADPASPLSPFGEPSREIREQEFAQFDRALVETRTSIPRDLAPHIGRILWFYQMGLLLFWIYDRSEGQRRSRQLLDASLPVVLLLIKLSNVPLLKPARRRVLKILSVLDA